MTKNNCKGCTERKIGCHSSCSSYLTYAAERETIRQNKNKDAAYWGYKYACDDKARRIHFSNKY